MQNSAQELASSLASSYFLESQDLIHVLNIPDTPRATVHIFSLFQYGLEIFTQAPECLSAAVRDELYHILIRCRCSDGLSRALQHEVICNCLLFMEAEDSLEGGRRLAALSSCLMELLSMEPDINAHVEIAHSFSNMVQLSAELLSEVIL